MSDRASEQLQRWIATERDRPAPGNAHSEQVWSRVQGRLEGSTAAPPWAPSARRPLWPWGVAGIAAVIVAGSAVIAMERPPAEAFESTTPVALSAPHTTARPPALLVLPTPVSKTTQPTSTAPPARSKSAVGGTFSDELALIERGRTALSGKQYGRVLEAMREHRAKFARGALREEAAALRTAATCASSGSSDAAASRFATRWPKSMHADLVRRHCG